MPTFEFTGPDGKTYEVGAPEGATQDQAFSLLQSQIGQSSAPANQAAPISKTERFAQGLRDPINGGAQLLTKMLPEGLVQAGNQANNWLADKTGLVGRLPEGGVDQQVKDDERLYQQRRAATEGAGGVDWMRIGGNVLSPANLAIGAATPVGPTLMARALAGAGSGAASAALSPVYGDNFMAEKGAQIGVGSALGGATPVVAQMASRLISPAASRNPNLQLLRSEGVQPTIGQTLGGWANRAEEKATSLPIVGDAISSARGRAQEQFNRAALNRALSPIGGRADEIGQGGVLSAQGAVRQAYDQAENALGNFRLDRQGVSDLRNIQQMAQLLADQERRQFGNIAQTIATDISPNGTIAQGAFKRIDSKLGAEAARFSGSSDAYQQQLGDAISAMRDSLRANAMRANPQASAMMDDANRAYANLVRVEGASKAAANSGGVFTPGQLNSAVRQADKSVRDRATASGTALMQDLSNAGQSVLGNKVPNSGTADRLMLGAGGLGAYFIDPLIPASLLGGAALYSSPAQSLLRGAVANRQQSAHDIARALLNGSPGLAPAAVQIGAPLLK